MSRYIIIRKPEKMSLKSFNQKVALDFTTYTSITNLQPVKLCSKFDDWYYLPCINKKLDVSEFGLEQLLFPLDENQIIAIKDNLETGKLDFNGLLSITQENIIELTHPIEADKQIKLIDIGPTDFEKKVTNIIRVLQKGGANVKWNSKIKDNSNPCQTRQIDISVEKNGKLIHIECRHRKKPQDVQWIEQLVGRKITMAIDGIIGVSSSGFTKTAKLTAQKHGILLKQLDDFNDLDALFWIGDLRFSFSFFQIETVKVKFSLNPFESIVNAHSEIHDFLSNGSNFRLFLYECFSNLKLNNCSNHQSLLARFDFDISSTSKYFGTVYVESIIRFFDYQGKRVNKQSYIEYIGESVSTEATIEERKLPNYKIEIIQTPSDLSFSIRYENQESKTKYLTLPVIRFEGGDIRGKKVSMDFREKINVDFKIEYEIV